MRVQRRAPRKQARLYPGKPGQERKKNMFAIIQTGGKQYKVSEGDIIFIEKLDAEVDSTVTFDQVLTTSDGVTLTVGTPTIAGAIVTGTVLNQGKEKKIYILTYKAKKNQKRKQGHRQPYTKVQITKIG